MDDGKDAVWVVARPTCGALGSDPPSRLIAATLDREKFNRADAGASTKHDEEKGLYMSGDLRVIASAGVTLCASARIAGMPKAADPDAVTVA